LPNLGKTCFLYYLLLRLLSNKLRVAFQVNKKYILFQDTGILLLDHDSWYPIESGTWALTDAHDGYWQPFEAFKDACALGNVWIVQTTSPSTEKWGMWSKELQATVHWMEVYSLDEMMALG
jgi:hypothetical protein